MRRPFAVVVLLLACAACGSPPADPPPPPAQTVDLTGVDPCSLLTADQRTTLDLDWVPPNSGSSHSSFYDTDVPSCVLSSSAVEMSVLVSLVDSTGIERFDDPTLQVRTTKLPATPLPALIARPTNLDSDCSVIIGTGPGHLIDVHAAARALKAPPASQQALCDAAVRAAGSVMATLDS